MLRRLVALTAGVVGIGLMAHVWAQPPWAPAAGNASEGFQGYWMGVDHVDGGDSRRSLVQAANGMYSLAGRDSVLSLCDGTDNGYASFSDGVVVGRGIMESGTLNLQCFNNGQSVQLHARYELIGRGRMIEVLTHTDGAAVSTIVFHKVSVD